MSYNTSYKSINGISYNHSLTEKSKTAHSFYKAESHTTVELLLVLSGQVDYSIDGAQDRIGSGSLIIINAGEFHSSKIDHTTDCERINLHFSPNFIPGLKDVDANSPFSNAHLYQHVIPSEIVKKSEIEALLRKIAPYCESDTKYKDLKIISLVQDIIAELNTVVDELLSDKYHLLLAPKITNELFQEAIHYINSEITQNINVADVATALGVSESYLHRLFKKIMGISVHNYIKNQKMQLALSLLKKGHSAQNVSEMLGYEYYATFFSQFMQVFGKRPTEFK